MGHVTAGIITNNLDVDELKKQSIELDLGIPVLRQRVCDENNVLN